MTRVMKGAVPPRTIENAIAGRRRVTHCLRVRSENSSRIEEVGVARARGG